MCAWAAVVAAIRAVCRSCTVGINVQQTLPCTALHPPAGYYPVSALFFLLSLPLTVLLKSWASVATIQLCQGGL